MVEVVARQKLDFCCIQESRWKGEGGKNLGSESLKCKFFWNGLHLNLGHWSLCKWHSKVSDLLIRLINLIVVM